MNILPLIFVFLTILSLFSYNFLQERMASHKELHGYRGYMRAERLARNRLESKKFQQTPQDKGSPEPRVTRPKELTFTSLRSRLPPSEASRLNIAPLFRINPPPFLNETAARLIRILYGHADFFIEANCPDLEYRILEQMHAQFDPQQTQTLSELFPNKPDLYAVFYKMIKGTNHYDIKQKLGYPPLEDFFALLPEKNKYCLQFPFASEPLLEALWGETITASILEMERTKWQKDRKHHTLVEHELQSLLGQDKGIKWELGTLKTYFNFSLKRPKLEKTQHTDEKTHITIRKNN